MTALLVYGGFILFVAVIMILAILTTKYYQKHNPRILVVISEKEEK